MAWGGVNGFCLVLAPVSSLLAAGRSLSISDSTRTILVLVRAEDVGIHLKMGADRVAQLRVLRGELRPGCPREYIIVRRGNSGSHVKAQEC